MEDIANRTAYTKQAIGWMESEACLPQPQQKPSHLSQPTKNVCLDNQNSNQNPKNLC